MKPRLERTDAPESRPDSTALGTLRAFVTLLVLAHHSLLAYCTFALPPPPSLLAPPRWWLAHPVVDPERARVFDVIVAFDDIFFMSLMFFLSGLFVWPSLSRKGVRVFLRDRVLRLGVPFVAAAALLAPLAYVPTYLEASPRPTAHGFVDTWLALGSWPAGPVWFLWVLLVFDAVAAMLARLLRRSRFVDRAASLGDAPPAAFFAGLVLLSAIAYLPMSFAFTPSWWSTVGPFTLQSSRALHYLVYFLAGVCVGMRGVARGLLAPAGDLARHWPAWGCAALLAFALAGAVSLAQAADGARVSWGWRALAGVSFVLSCAASSLASLAVFLRFARRRSAMGESLRANAYGMFVIHFPIATWLQYALLATAIPGVVKGTAVFLATVALSWGSAAVLRRRPAIARLIGPA